VELGPKGLADRANANAVAHSGAGTGRRTWRRHHRFPASVATVESTGAAPAAAVATAPAGGVISTATNATAPAGAASTASLTVTPLETAAAIVGIAIAVGAAPSGLASARVGGSSSAATTAVRRPRHPLGRQQLSYVSEHGFTTFVVHLRAGCEVRLLLPPISSAP
jgi:hypothetical protein